jgi:hypothetical protein
MKYYNEMRTHLSLEKDTPVPRAVEGTSIVDLYWAGCIINMSGFDLRQAELSQSGRSYANSISRLIRK